MEVIFSTLMRLENKVILITGSATGIGCAIAKRCVAEGARVVIHGLEPDLAAAVVDELGADNAVSHIEDLNAEGCPQRLVEVAVKSFGRLDAVVNNAAMVGQKILEMFAADEFDVATLFYAQFKSVIAQVPTVFAA